MSGLTRNGTNKIRENAHCGFFQNGDVIAIVSFVDHDRLLRLVELDGSLRDEIPVVSISLRPSLEWLTSAPCQGPDLGAATPVHEER